MLFSKAGKSASTEVQTSDVRTKLALITKKVTEDAKFKFTSLAHLLSEQTLGECYRMLGKGKAPGIDDVTFEEYGQYLNTNIMKLVKKMKAGKYYPLPVRRAYIPKGEGKLRPLGIPALEDKIVQMGITRILNAIYEPIFLDCSYGFREGRGCLQALKQLDNKVMTKPVNHIIDADIRGFFDNVDHDWMMKMLRERIADPNLLKLIWRFLKAGYMEDGVRHETEEGTPQGGVISPVLSNIYLHYVLDLWVEKVVKRDAQGYVEIIRYADDFVIMVQYRQEAEKILEALKDRLEKFSLELSVEKTRLIEFGQYARVNAERKGEKPASFDFLGFTHYADISRKGKYKVGRKTRRKKFTAKLKELNQWLKSMRNAMLWEEVWKKLHAKLRGHYEYYGISGNFRSIKAYYTEARRLAYKWMNRRSQRKSRSWAQFTEYLKHYPLPLPAIRHNIYLFGTKQ